jgi:peptide subunit release factor 1 (eRF1)
LKHWNQLFIHPEKDMSEEDVRDFVEWVCRKAERLGFKVELKTYQKEGSGSSEAISTHPLVPDNEAY